MNVYQRQQPSIHGQVMFEEARLLGSTERSIALETHLGRPIDNIVELDPQEREIRIYEHWRNQFGTATERKAATGVYNCAGHVWASRRTSILSQDAFKAILEDDGYHKLGLNDHLEIGDVALYRASDEDEILHVGRVAGFRRDAGHTPRILSKLNSTSGELIHDATDVPHLKQFQPAIEYWTDR